MNKFFDTADFITTDFINYTAAVDSVWSEMRERDRLFQHTDLPCSNGLPMFTQNFEVAKTEGTKIIFSALGCINIFINGKRIGTGELNPGWTDYNKRALSIEYDISGSVRPGLNRVLAVVAPGWYSGRISGGYYGNHSPAFVAVIKNGNDTILSTDESWLCKVGGQIRTADIWDGEFRDGREDNYEDISKTDYPLDSWKPSDIYDYTGVVTPLIGPEIRVRNNLTLTPVSLKKSDGIIDNGTDFGKLRYSDENANLPINLSKNEKLTVDFGQESVGWAAIKVSGPKGTRIKIRYSEFLNDSGREDRGNDGPEGSVYTINLRSALGKAYYILSGKSSEIYRPTFTFFGYRYVEISTDNDVTLENICAEVVGTATEEIGTIETDSTLVNKLISNTLWGQRSNYLSVPTDCPQRDERLGWTGDAQAFSITAAYNADVYEFFRKWMQDMRDSQSEDGGYGFVNPKVSYCDGDDASAWSDAGIIIPYNMYMMYGNKQIIEEHFDSMEAYMNGIMKKFGPSGSGPVFGDWLAYDQCSNEFISSAYFVHDCDLMIKMSRTIGKEDKAAYYISMREKAYNHFKENYLKDGFPAETTQCNKILSLAFDLIDEDKRNTLSEMLAGQIKENGNRLSCGFLGTYNLCPALSKFNQDKTAYNLLLQTEEPSWLYSVLQGATTIWERWNSYTISDGFGDVGMNSFNHYAYGSIVEWLYGYAAGIMPEEPGFSKIRLSPRIDNRNADEIPDGQRPINHLKATYKSASGLIRSEWNTENGFIYKCEIPVNTVLYLPVTGTDITMNGNSITPDIKDGKAVIELLPGKYEFIQ